MLHHPLEEHQRPPTGDDITAALEQAERFVAIQREQRREHCRGLTDSELCAELNQAKAAMRDRLQDAGSYLDAKERRNAALDVAYERGIPVRSVGRDSGRSF